jgi:hypothetical protein
VQPGRDRLAVGRRRGAAVYGGEAVRQLALGSSDVLKGHKYLKTRMYQHP